VVGAGPAGLTAALYLARYKREFLLVDSGSPRVAWVPMSHNVPMFQEGIAGKEILRRQRAQLEHYNVVPLDATVALLHQMRGHFVARIERAEESYQVRARHVLLATGAVDIEPALPELPHAVQRGLVRYCPICDAYEATGKRIGVIGFGARGLSEAIFVARSYSRDVTLLTLGEELILDDRSKARCHKHGVKVVQERVILANIERDRISVVRTASGQELSFDVLYSALGLKLRTELALALGAKHDETGGLIVDEHNQTSVQNLYAAGGVVRGLDQIVVAMGHAAVAATGIHNSCNKMLD
jgi:thioredoxin reductase (NADPH)